MQTVLNATESAAAKRRDPQALVTHLRNISLRIQTLAGRTGLSEAEKFHLRFLQRFFWQGVDQLVRQERIAEHQAVELVIARARQEQGEQLLMFQVVGSRTVRRLRSRPMTVEPSGI